MSGGVLPQSGGPVAQVRDLAFAYPDGRQVLYGVDLRVERGERVALLGPNGAGKTSLVLHLPGLLGAVVGGHGAGTVEVDGQALRPDDLARARRAVGIVFQDPDDQLFCPTVRDDVAFGPINAGLSPQEVERRVETALAAVGMSGLGDRAPYHLSFGQKRRVALATVLATDPLLLVLDEPSSNLDPAARREFAEVVQALPMAVLMVTHDLPYALQLCSRSVLIDEGRIVADRPTRELLSDEALLHRHRLELPYGFRLV